MIGVRTDRVMRDAAIDVRLGITGCQWVTGLSDDYLGDFEPAPRSIDARDLIPSGGMEVHGTSAMVGLVKREGPQP
jgi:hypothetical protein